MKKIIVILVVIALLISYVNRRKLFKMILSKPVFEGANFTWYEVTQTGTGFPNVPTSNEMDNIKLLVANILQPLRDKFGPVTLSSVFRSQNVNEAVGGSQTSQHREGLAADIIKVAGKSLQDVFNYIKNSSLPYDQLIYETGSAANPAAEWIHVSYNPNGGRRQALLAPYDYQKNKRIFKSA